MAPVVRALHFLTCCFADHAQWRSTICAWILHHAEFLDLEHITNCFTLGHLRIESQNPDVGGRIRADDFVNHSQYGLKHDCVWDGANQSLWFIVAAFLAQIQIPTCTYDGGTQPNAQVSVQILSSGAVMKEPSLRCVKLPSNPPTFQQYVDPNSFYKGSVDRMKDVNEYALRGSLVNEPQSGSRTYNCCILFVPKTKGAVKRNQMTVLVTTQSVRSGEEFLTHYGDDPNWRHRDTPRSRDTPRASRRELGLSSPGQGADGTRSWTGASPII